MPVRIPPPRLQIEFSVALAEIRRLYLVEALSATVSRLKIAELDKEIGQLVPPDALAKVAAHTLRAELIFPVPMLLKANPYLLGYYRLLYGFSQKIFYTAETGVGSFKAMEMRGVLSSVVQPRLEGLCKVLIGCGVVLLDGIGPTRLSRELLDDR
jgi:XcyI restriction endonuclease